MHVLHEINILIIALSGVPSTLNSIKRNIVIIIVILNIHVLNSVHTLDC